MTTSTAPADPAVRAPDPESLHPAISRARAKLPPARFERPAMTILPSAWMATSWAQSSPRVKSTIFFPPLPNVS